MVNPIVTLTSQAYRRVRGNQLRHGNAPLIYNTYLPSVYSSIDIRT